jgi:hypothetical protein
MLILACDVPAGFPPYSKVITYRSANSSAGPEKDFDFSLTNFQTRGFMEEDRETGRASLSSSRRQMASSPAAAPTKPLAINELEFAPFHLNHTGTPDGGG